LEIVSDFPDKYVFGTFSPFTRFKLDNLEVMVELDVTTMTLIVDYTFLAYSISQEIIFTTCTRLGT